MKTIANHLAKTALFAVVLFFAHRSAGQAGHLLFSAHLSGAEENPPVATNGEGLITVRFNDDRSKMFVQGVVSQLSGPVSAAHFHTGIVGQNGGVVVNLAPIRNGNRFAGELPVPAGFLENALKRGIYANVHTAANPSGEIRGQLLPESDLNFGAVLTGLNEVPPVLTTALGIGGVNITLGYDKLKYNILVNGLSGPITGAHIHKGAAGAAGPVVQPLGFSGNSLVGEVALNSLPADFMMNLFAGQYYVNVHTAANPGGEIRGQLLFNGFLNGVAILNGDQETPPVTTSASGIGFVLPNAAMDSVIYGVLVRGLSGSPTAAHVHKAPAGTAGGVVFPLAAGPVPGVYSSTVPVNAAFLTDFINNNLYFNVHTAANPAGEIRGQIQTNLRKAYTFDLCAGQENPFNNSQGYGAGMVSIDQGNLALTYKLAVDGLTGAASAAHIHTAVVGANGPVRFPLSLPNPFSEGALAITGADAVVVEAQGTYMNVHTVAHPGGEIRGQVHRGILCASFSEVLEPIIVDLKVFPNPTTEGLTIRFNNKEEINGQLRLTDVSGRVLESKAIGALASGPQELYMPLQKLLPGLYLLHLEHNGATVFVQSVVKQ